MLDFLSDLFDTSDFPARWQCGNWTPWQGWLHIISDVGIWSAYVAIPFVLAYFVMRRKNVPFRSVFWLFVAFILACSATHLMDAAVFWWPAYRLAGTIKLVTAVVSWCTVLALVPILPKALAMRTPDELEKEIVARKQTEAKLLQVNRDLEHRMKEDSLFRLLIETVADHAIYLLDSEGRVASWNVGAERIKGYAASEIIGQHFSVFYSKEQAEDGLPQRHLEAALAARRFEAAEWQIRKDGSRFWANVTIFPLQDRFGTHLGFAKITHDLTERRRTEEAIEAINAGLENQVQQRTSELRSAIKELAQSNLDLEQFAYVASHDLQEPLRAVAGCVQVLKKRYQGQLDARADDLIAHTVDGASRMQSLIDDLLTYARVGTRGSSFGTGDCNVILGQAVANLQTAIKETAAVVTHDQLPTLMADSGQLIQLFQNLLSNAIKFRSQSPPRIHVGVRREMGQWVFSVSDNGIGMKPEYLGRIFVIFQRLHTRNEYPGTGIGLAICKKIVERLGGHITVKSEPGKGSTFCFTIPVQGEER